MPSSNSLLYSPVPGYSVPFCLRILNCSGDRIARHSSSGLLTDPGAGEAIAVIRPPWKPRPRRRSGGRTLGFEGEKVSRVVLRETEGLTKALMVEAKVIQVAEDDDDMTFSAIVALSLPSPAAARIQTQPLKTPNPSYYPLNPNPRTSLPLL